MFSPTVDPEKITKKINSKNFIDKDFYSLNKNKLTFMKKLTKEITDSVTADLDKIKSLHDDLEKLYINAMDYPRINEFTTQFIDKI